MKPCGSARVHYATLDQRQQRAAEDRHYQTGGTELRVLTQPLQGDPVDRRKHERQRQRNPDDGDQADHVLREDSGQGEAHPESTHRHQQQRGPELPSRYVMRNREDEKQDLLACRYQPAASAGTPTTSRAYWMVNDHAHTCAATLKNWAATPYR